MIIKSYCQPGTTMLTTKVPPCHIHMSFEHCRDGNSITILESLFQNLATRSVKKFFLVPNLNLCRCNLEGTLNTTYFQPPKSVFLPHNGFQFLLFVAHAAYICVDALHLGDQSGCLFQGKKLQFLLEHSQVLLQFLAHQ